MLGLELWVGRLDNFMGMVWSVIHHPQPTHAQRERIQPVGHHAGPTGDLDQGRGVGGVLGLDLVRQVSQHDQLPDQVRIPAIHDHTDHDQPQGSHAVERLAAQFVTEQNDHRHNCTEQHFKDPEVERQLTAGQHVQAFGAPGLVGVGDRERIPEAEVQIPQSAPTNRPR